MELAIFLTWAAPVFIWLVVNGLLAGWLATERGRSRDRWQVLGFLLGPLALLLIGFAPIQPNGKFDFCDTCGEVVRQEALKCPHCGEDFDG